MLYNKTKRYYVLSSKIDLFSNETEHGWQTVADIDNHYTYLDNRDVSLDTAIYVWEFLNNRLLTAHELRQIKKDNYEDEE